LYVRGNPVNLVDPSGESPSCQTCGPEIGGFWDRKARISCNDLLSHGGFVEGAMESYLKAEGSSDPASLLTRVVMAEEGEQSKRVDALWVIRLRMEIAFTNNWAKEGDKTSLSQELFHDSPVQFSTIWGYSDGQSGMVEVINPREEALGVSGDIIGMLCGNGLNAGVYPCDNAGGIDASIPDSEVLREWAITYAFAQLVLSLNLDNFIDRFPLDLREGSIDSFNAGGFFNQTSRDDDWIWSKDETTN
jgi:hypothetical protein